MTSIEELFLSIENAYPHAEKAFSKYSQDCKAVRAIPVTGLAVLVCGVSLPPAVCKQPWRGWRRARSCRTPGEHN